MLLCPMASEMMVSLMPHERANDAQVWRPLYKAYISEKIDAKKIIDNNEYQ